MKYSEAKAMLPNANHIYIGVTDKELSKVSCTMYLTDIGDIKVLGTLEPVEVLAKKELIPGSMSFD